mmetsp:Transcript_35559/g.82333  ORF Transcript_35559/g.82333 Transcript_35559/m.82333 type:complete len:210 (+) Transcript_35559:680-1309(+)
MSRCLGLGLSTPSSTSRASTCRSFRPSRASAAAFSPSPRRSTWAAAARAAPGTPRTPPFRRTSRRRDVRSCSRTRSTAPSTSSRTRTASRSKSGRWRSRARSWPPRGHSNCSPRSPRSRAAWLRSPLGCSPVPLWASRADATWSATSPILCWRRTCRSQRCGCRTGAASTTVTTATGSGGTGRPTMARRGATRGGTTSWTSSRRTTASE